MNEILMTKRRSLDQINEVAKQKLPLFLFRRFMEGAYIFVLAISIYVFLSLATYTATDPNWTHVTKGNIDIANAGGRVGAYLADALYWLFGYFAYALPLSVAYLSGLLVQESKQLVFNKWSFFLRTSGLIFFMLGTCALLGLNPNLSGPDGIPGAGGMLGAFLADGFDGALNKQGASLFLLAISLVGITWLTGFSWINAVEKLGQVSGISILNVLKILYGIQRWVARFLRSYIFYARPQFLHFSLPSIKNLTLPTTARVKPTLDGNRPQLQEENPPPPTGKKRAGAITSATIKNKPPAIQEGAQSSTSSVVEARPDLCVSLSENSTQPSFHTSGLPNLTLLDSQELNQVKQGYTPDVLEQLSRELEQHLLDFGIHVDVVAVHPGPVITRFELQLAAGVKVSRLTALAKDLARALSVISVRVVEVIPGKTVVGLELPNQHREMVRLSRVLSSDVYQHAHSPLTLALGVDIAGYPMVVDLAKMPHLLVAGTTGSGKSVGVNAMILSLLFKCSPEQVRLIMIDPKMLELSIYDGIPHLLTPVVTDMKEAASALRWCVAEMERRYRLLASVGVRNLQSYNAKVSEAIAQDTPLLDPTWKGVPGSGDEGQYLSPLPYVVVIIDELADMMMVVGKKVEQLIARIAQKARAAGIHLILATQRPSVDVLTGLIKSNIPTRISFQVSSKIDSRTILDGQGAEQLLGHGDMLFLAPGTGAPLRVHGAFVDDAEVHRVAEDWRSRGKPDYIDEIVKMVSDDPQEESGQEESDPLYDEAVAFVIETRKGSISAVQRRFKIGYNRAARLIETMEEAGILGPLEGGMRDVLVSGEIG